MKHAKYILITALIVGSGLFVLNQQKYKNKIEHKTVQLRTQAIQSFQEMNHLYSERLRLLSVIDLKQSNEIEKQLSLITPVNLVQYDLLQNKVSARLSKWMKSRTSKKSKLTSQLQKLESDIVQKRGEYHNFAFELNSMLEREKLKQPPLIVFEPEYYLFKNSRSRLHVKAD